MIEEPGVVVRVSPGRALVRTERSSSCEACGARGTCSSLGGGREARVWADDPVGVKACDRVIVAVPDSTVLRAALLVYLLPVASLLAGALLGGHLARVIGISADLGAAGVGVVAMAAVFLAVRYLGAARMGRPKIVWKA